MSGICGIWSPQPDQHGIASAVRIGLDAIAHRGRDGFSIYADGKVALGHCLLDTGCNGLAVDESGYALSFDGRIDNREALVGLLRDNGADHAIVFERMHDKDLLLLAYRHFGTGMLEHLRGDFALAVLDPERNALVLCRDHFGVRPLFYRWHRGALHFCSEIKGLRAMAPEAPLTRREAAIQNFLDGSFDPKDAARTFYEEAYRLLPAHCAVIDIGGMAVRRYWELAPGLPRARKDGPAHFKALFGRAIDARLRGTAPAAALLSGGLDSSAIVSMIGARQTCANPGAIPIFSLVFSDDAVEDESVYIDAVLSMYGLAGARIEGSGITAFADAPIFVAEQDHPPAAPNLCTFRQLLRTVADTGAHPVVLHGHGGDEVLSYGSGLFAELAERGRWLKLWQALGESGDFVESRLTFFRQLILARGLRHWRRVAGRWLGRGRHRPHDNLRSAPDGSPRPLEQISHLKKLLSPLYGYGLEVIDHDAAAAGVELRMPFLDLDLVSYCVTVPAVEKWSGGYPRAFLRKALAGLLPPAVANRRDKFNFGPHVSTSMVRDHAVLIDRMLADDADLLAPYADLDALREQWRRFRETGGEDHAARSRIWRAVVLSHWLRQQNSSIDESVLEAAE